MPADYTILYEGSVVLITPHNSNAAEWLRSNTSHEPWQWFGSALVIDIRFADGLLDEMRLNGFTID